MHSRRWAGSEMVWDHAFEGVFGIGIHPWKDILWHSRDLVTPFIGETIE